MLISFQIIKPRQTLSKQWAYLVKRGNHISFLRLKKKFIGLVTATVLCLLLYFLTPTNNFIILKALSIVMVTLAWSAIIVFYLFFILSRQKRERQLQRFLNSTTDEQLSYLVSIDEEKVTIVSHDNTFEMPWTEFNQFGIHDDTLYVFNQVNRYDSLYWDKSEMGTNAFSALLELLNKKSIKQAF
jgi:hypothetical protein